MTAESAEEKKGREPRMNALAEDSGEAWIAAWSAAAVHWPRRARGQADGRGGGGGETRRETASHAKSAKDAKGELSIDPSALPSMG